MVTKYEPGYEKELKKGKEKQQAAAQLKGEGKEGEGGGFDFAALLERKASLKHALGLGAIGAAILFLFYLAKLVVDYLAVKAFSLITANVYAIALFIPILIGLGLGFGLKRLESEATVADGAICGATAGIIGSALAAIAILVELFLLKINAPYLILAGQLGGVAMLFAVSAIQTLLCILATAITVHFIKGEK
jgi:hypothetical protein